MWLLQALTTKWLLFLFIEDWSLIIADNDIAMEFLFIYFILFYFVLFY